jgi:hypothetical protein
MTLEEFNNLAGGVESFATLVALCVGGYWAYTRFIRQRESYAFIEFTVDINFVGRQSGFWIVELIAHLENKGKVQHRFSDLTFHLEALFTSDPVCQNAQFGGQTYFPHEIEKRSWLPSGSYFIEPGLKAKYSYIAQIPEDASFVMLHGRFTYENQPAWHAAERTLSVPRRTVSD